ncbi:sugar kinase [Oculatella sp. LEGE 06141]|uniref:PfkB family carbohydrate kinase n=1 Tax=Oculatella sp. LEGE 06141 TaxID=1828648 RepID=UPI00187F3D76|nr:PfkB family carbohydrate kinase [Oculatella sp. LEGE 06141]MBE9177159.1 sugar kinase [Oculatella sp. LEGE 06141]
MNAPKHGLFVGLTTLDISYLTVAPPDRNQKIVALDCTMAAGGPATNAAVTFRYLGNRATLLSAVGVHPMTQLVLTDVRQRGVAVADLDPNRMQSLPISSIIVTQSTGERAVVSLNATKSQVSSEAIAQALGDRIPVDTLAGVDVVLVDGHQMAVGRAIAGRANAYHIPVVIDAGSWKAGFEQVLCQANFVIASANFYPPGCQTTADVFAYLTHLGIPHMAVTRGGEAIQFSSEGRTGTIPIPQASVVDTLGAGDIFHGAFCHYIIQTSFAEALAQAAAVAARACQSFGTRQWMDASRQQGIES